MSESAPFHQLRPRTLIRQQVFQRIAEDILTGRLRELEEIHDTDLQSEYGVSRTPIREAILQLADLGLIELRSNQFTRVAPVDVGRHLECWEAAHSLVAHSAEIVAPRITSAQLQRVRECAARVTSFDLRDHVTLRTWYDFHAEVVRVADNTVASALLHDRLRLHILRPVTNARPGPDVSKRLIRYTDDLTAALERADAPAARELVMAAFDIIAVSLREIKPQGTGAVAASAG